MNPDDDLSTEPLNRIVCAAIRRDDVVICGARHYDPVMLRVLRTIYGVRQHREKIDEQGFIDNKGEFLTRAQAWNLATRTGQIRNPNVSGGRPGELFSEHLY